MTIQVNDFPHCCGARTISNLWCLTRSQLVEQLRELKSDGVGLAVAITSPAQREVVKLFDQTGFQALDNFTNPSTHRELTVWVFNFSTTKIPAASASPRVKRTPIPKASRINGHLTRHR